MRNCLIVLAVLLAPSLGLAQKAKPWAQEPAAVFGIPLGQTFGNERIAECGGVKVEDGSNPVSACSMYRPSYGNLTIAGFPVDVFDGGLVMREDDVVTSIYLHGKQSNYRAIKTLMLERYGRPTSTSVETLQNGMGAKFNSELLIWSGKAVTLVLKERNESVDTTAAHFSHNAHAVKKMIDREKALKDSASKM